MGLHDNVCTMFQGSALPHCLACLLILTVWLTMHFVSQSYMAMFRLLLYTARCRQTLSARSCRSRQDAKHAMSRRAGSSSKSMKADMHIIMASAEYTILEQTCCSAHHTVSICMLCCHLIYIQSIVRGVCQYRHLQARSTTSGAADAPG